MTIHQSLPFKIGDLAETKSFLKGFRCAWFPCKIHDIKKKRGHIEFALEYFDYPDDKVTWMRIYQKQIYSSLKKAERVLMTRPHYPKVYRESELHNVNTIAEVSVVVDDDWKVGDLVDWLSEGCFWSGIVTEIKGEDEVKIKLPEPPIGEGKIYDAKCKDLRPSLDWSPEIGWTVPEPLESQNGRSCARLILPTKPEDDKQNIRSTPNSLLEFNESTSSKTSGSSLPLLSKSMHSGDLVEKNKDVSDKDMLQTHGAHRKLDIGGSSIGRPSCSDGVSSTSMRDVSGEVPGANSTLEQYGGNVSVQKRMGMDETIGLNSTSDNIESSITGLEGLLYRVKELRQILKHGTPSTSEGPKWKFLGLPSDSTPK